MPRDSENEVYQEVTPQGIQTPAQISLLVFSNWNHLVQSIYLTDKEFEDHGEVKHFL